MQTGDIIAIGIVVVCVLLGIRGVLKWVIRAMAGLALGILILACIALLSGNAEFDQMSRSVFRKGTVMPLVRTQINHVGKFISERSQASRGR